VLITKELAPKNTGKHFLNPVVFFLMGMGEDVLSAGYVSAVGAGNGVLAGLVAMVITFLAVFALGKMLLEPKLWSVRLWCFAVGNFCGTYLVVTNGHG
jgi:hypothetical protein